VIVCVGVYAGVSVGVSVVLVWMICCVCVRGDVYTVRCGCECGRMCMCICVLVCVGVCMYVCVCER